jgi:hypothetical protein
MGETKPWVTWLNMHSPKPTTAEMIDSCVANAEDAARKEGHARQRYDRAEPESVALFDAADDIRRYVAEQKHWRRCADEFRRKLAQERDDAERARSREVGADDGEEAAAAAEGDAQASVRAADGDEDDDRPLSAWEDIGAGVRT